VNIVYIYIKHTLLFFRLASEKDAVEREVRDKETRILSLSRELETLRDQLAESERVRTQQQRDLDSYANSQDDVGKNVSRTCRMFIV
jgi:myosin protein heavy chain